MIKASDLIAKFQQALNEHWGYIYGKTHEMWSEEKQKAYAKEYADDPDRANSVKYGGKWAGHWVTDCSGLFTWAFREFGGSIAHGSNSIWDKYCTKTGGLHNILADGWDNSPGMAVFTVDSEGRHNHIGLYIGHDTVIEAKGCKAGVTTSSLHDDRWRYWGKLKGVDYSTDDEEETRMYATVVLPTGASGKTVNMRDDDSKKGKILKQVPVGSTVAVLADMGEWCMISYGGIQGYMMANYLEYPDQDGESSDDEVKVPAAELEAIYDKIGDWLGKRG